MNSTYLFNDLYYDINSISSAIIKSLYKQKNQQQYRLLKNNVCLFYQNLSLSNKNKFLTILNNKGYKHILDDERLAKLSKFHSARFEDFCGIYLMLNGFENNSHSYLSSKYENCKNNFNMFYASLGSSNVDELNRLLELL